MLSDILRQYHDSVTEICFIYRVTFIIKNMIVMYNDEYIHKYTTPYIVTMVTYHKQHLHLSFTE